MYDTRANYIGFDPVAWVERLEVVNAGSQFPQADKSMIAEGLAALRTRLEGRAAASQTVAVLAGIIQ